jgi:hypothetical protein
MSTFSIDQLKKLTSKLDRCHVQSRKMDDRDVDYIEGWFAIAEANAIFGFGGCDREMAHFERVFERARGDLWACAYLARVRIRVRAGKRLIVREGTGWGAASCKIQGDAHERAIKAAETDATKRALATFGNRFGLGLYDKDQAGVTARPLRNTFVIKDPLGAVFARDLSSEGFCTGLRQIIENDTHRTRLDAWHTANASEIARLKEIAPDLKNGKGEHFADLLERLFQARLARIPLSPSGSFEGHGIVDDTGDAHSPSSIDGADHPDATEGLIQTGPESPGSTTPAAADGHGLTEAMPLKPSRIASGGRIDKAALPIAIPRRLRDKDHLRHVGTLPCLVCQAIPSHPHHLTFAQPRGLSLKVSDEFVVPLCVLHHNDVHRAGAERVWWQRAGIDPLPVAKALWEARMGEREAAHAAAE